MTNLLSAALAQCCVQNQIAGSLVANVADLKHLVRWHLDGRAESRRPALLQGWRDGLCGGSCSTCSKGDWPCASSTRRASSRSLELEAGIDEPIRPPTAVTNRDSNHETNRELFHQLLRARGRLDGGRADRETGIDHLELALRGHNFGGLVIPESAVITEKADDADGAGVLRPSAPVTASRSAAATSAGPTSAPAKGSS